jgi:hypothetical protein
MIWDGFSKDFGVPPKHDMVYMGTDQMIKPIITHSYSYHICFGMKTQKISTSCLGVASMDHPYYGDAECENEVCNQWMAWVI